jgi:hypothetical protein
MPVTGIALVLVFYCLRFEYPPIWRARFPYLYPQEHGSPFIPQVIGFLFVASYDSQEWDWVKVRCIFDLRSVGQSLLVSDHYLGRVINFSFFPLKLSLDSCGFDIMGRPLWREDGSVIHSHCCEIVSAVFLRSEFRGTHDQSLLSELWDSPSLEGCLKLEIPQFRGPGSRIYFAQEEGSPVIPPGNGRWDSISSK